MKYTNHHIIPDAGKYTFEEAEKLCGFTQGQFNEHCERLIALLIWRRIVFSSREEKVQR